MERFLCRQPRVTLAGWLEEKDLIPSDNVVSDIINYYSYLDVLLVSTIESIVLSELIFSNDEICSCIVSHCFDVTLRYVFLSCKRFARIIHIIPSCWRSDFYYAVICMDWRYMCLTFRSSDTDNYISLREAAKRGYELDIDSLYADYGQLSIEVARNSATFQWRHYNLCVKFNKLQGNLGKYEHRFILRACIQSGPSTGKILNDREDVRIFKHFFEYKEEYVWYLSLQCAYYGRIDLFTHIHVRKSPGSEYTEFKLILDHSLTAAYCGGNYEAMHEFCSSIQGYTLVSKDDMLDIVISSDDERKIVPKSLDVLLSLCDTSNINKTIPVFAEMERTLDEFKRYISLVDTNLYGQYYGSHILPGSHYQLSEEEINYFKSLN